MATLTVRVPGNTAWSDGHATYAEAMEEQRKAKQVTGIDHKIFADAEAADIEALRQEAAEVGDASMVDVCDAALSGDRDAWRECEAVIKDAAAGVA